MGKEATVKQERGVLAPGKWSTIYSGAVPRSFVVHLSGSIPAKARIEVEIGGSIQGTLTQSNPQMHANGKVIRLHNDGSVLQGYTYYPG